MPRPGAGGIVRELSERKFLTILFADIRNSTGVIRDLDPEDAMAKLRPAIDLMIAAVREAGGMVNRIQGDGIMALFGAPLAVDDHPVRACRAALLMRDRIVTELGDKDIAIRVGVHSGDVVAHIDSGDFSHAYDVTGPAAHFAARLEQAADANTALVSEQTWKLTRGALEGRPRHGLAIKGFETSVEAWELTGFGQRSRWLARQLAGLTPFVGRSEVLAEMRARLQRALDGISQVIAVGGEGGTGKSRLVHELLGSQVAGRWSVWDAECEVTSSRASFAVLRQLLRRWLNVDEASDYGRLPEALQMRVAGIDLPPHGAAALRALLNMKVEDPVWQELDLAARARAIEATVAAVLRHVSKQAPLAILVEDFHLADADSRNLLLKLPTMVPSASIALLITHRQFAELPKPNGQVHLSTLGELPLDAAETLLDGMLGPDASLAAIRQQLLSAAGHLPFFLEESVRHLLDTGALRGSIGACVAASADTTVVAPRSAQAVASARIDALQPAERTLVRNAAAIGKRFPRVLLGDIHSGSEAALASILHDLAQRHILFESGDFVEFRHDFIRDAAYGALLRDQRQVMHRVILIAIENRYAAQARDWTPALAYHAAQAQDWVKATDYERQTAEQAMEASSYPAALAACNRALAHVERLPRDRPSIEREIDLRLMLRATVAPDSFTRWVEQTARALELAEQIGDARRQVTAAAQRAWALNFGGAPKDAVPAAEKALTLATSTRSETAMCAASLVLGQAQYAAGSFRQATQALRFPQAWLSGERRFMRHGTAGTSLAIALLLSSLNHAWMGEIDRALEDCRRARSLAEETRRPYDLAMAEYGAGIVDLQDRRAADAVARLEAALAICRESGLQGLVPLVLTYLGAANLRQGRLDEAAGHLEQTLGLSGRIGFTGVRIAATTYLSGVRAGQGKGGEATALAEESCRMAGDLGFMAHKAMALRYRACAQVIEGPRSPNEAAKLLDEAIALARQCEMHVQVGEFEELAARLAAGQLPASADAAAAG